MPAADDSFTLSALQHFAFCPRQCALIHVERFWVENTLTAWQKRKQDEVEHAFLDYKIPVELLLHAQALLLARHLRGDLDAYPPFEWR